MDSINAGDATDGLHQACAVLKHYLVVPTAAVIVLV